MSVVVPDPETAWGRNLNPLGILWLVASVFHLMGCLVLFIVAHTLLGRLAQIQDVWPM